MNYGSEVMVSKTTEKMYKNKITPMTGESDYFILNPLLSNFVISETFS